MKSVDQTRDGETGNCYAAALASLLEVPIDWLPDIHSETINGKNWRGYMLAYLWKHHAKTIIALDPRLVSEVVPVGFHIINGESPRNPEHGHATVGFQGELVHDPHPSRAGLAKVHDYDFLVDVKLDRIEDQSHRQAMKKWLEQCPCICRHCAPTRRQTAARSISDAELASLETDEEMRG